MFAELSLNFDINQFLLFNYWTTVKAPSGTKPHVSFPRHIWYLTATIQNFFIVKYSNGMVHETDRASAGTASALILLTNFWVHYMNSNLAVLNENIRSVLGFALLLRVELAGIFFAYSRNESNRWTRSTVPSYAGTNNCVPKSGGSSHVSSLGTEPVP